MNKGKIILLCVIAVLILSFLIISIFAKSPLNTSEGQSNPPPDPWTTLIIPPGGSIFSILDKAGIPHREIATFAFRFGDYIDVTTIQPGDTLRIQTDPDRERLTSAMFVQEPTIRHFFEVVNDSLRYTLEELPVEHHIRIIEGILQNTLDASLIKAGLTPGEKQQINNGLEGDVDFSMSARNGDRFVVMLEERIFEGKKMPGSKILFVSYEGERAGKHELFRYETGDEKSVFNGLYNKEGKTNTSSAVGFPLSRIHVTSAFGRRIDPFTGRWTHHEGVDYRAGHGIPVYAVADGDVNEARYAGGYGKNVRIRHRSGMITHYAHLSSIGVRQGQKVRKGQVIGRVGSTGRSTGPHLHFGLIQNGRWINPRQLKMVGAEKLNDKQMAEFRQQQQTIRELLIQVHVTKGKSITARYMINASQG